MNRKYKMPKNSIAQLKFSKRKNKHKTDFRFRKYAMPKTFDMYNAGTLAEKKRKSFCFPVLQ